MKMIKDKFAVKGIYSIYDKKSEVYNDPFFAVNDLVAKRTFRSIVNDKNAVNQFPDDFKMCKIGYFDSSLGLVSPTTAEGKLSFCVEASDVQEILE